MHRKTLEELYTKVSAVFVSGWWNCAVYSSNTIIFTRSYITFQAENTTSDKKDRQWVGAVDGRPEWAPSLGPWSVGIILGGVCVWGLRGFRRRCSPTVTNCTQGRDFYLRLTRYCMSGIGGSPEWMMGIPHPHGGGQCEEQRHQNSPWWRSTRVGAHQIALGGQPLCTRLPGHRGWSPIAACLALAQRRSHHPRWQDSGDLATGHLCLEDTPGHGPKMNPQSPVVHMCATAKSAWLLPSCFYRESDDSL